MNKLIIADDEGKTTIVPLVRDEITIGRKEGNTIRLTERNVSRRHALLKRLNGQFILEDTESYNGVFINGELIETPRTVQDGDRITIGDYQLSLRSDRPAAGARPSEQDRVAPPPYPRLVMLGPPKPGREFPLEDGEIIIGRTDENAIVINHPSISRSHAKISVIDGHCRLSDLRSANGVRVNNEDYSDVSLRSGDLVELGTVKLRFVGPNEDFQFDADATVQMDPVPEDVLAALDGRSSSLVPILIAVVILALIAIGVALFIWSSSTTDGGSQITTPVEPVLEKAQPVPEPKIGPSADEILSRARDLMKEERYDTAIVMLESAVVEENTEAQQLKDLAGRELEAQGLFKRACDETDQNDHKAVYAACQKIDTESQYHEKGCCSGAPERFATNQIKLALKLAKGSLPNLQQAAEIARELTEAPSISERQRKQAERIAEQVDRKLRAVAVRPAAVKVQKVETVEPEVPEKAGPSRPNAQDALEAARACVIRNDQHCCIRALIKAPRTSRVVQTLISCYRQTNMSAACNMAKRYQQYPHAKQFFHSACR